MKNIIKLLFLLLLLLVQSCQEEDPKPHVYTNTELLTTGRWYRVGWTTNIARVNRYDSTLTTNIFEAMPECDRDNNLIFKPDGDVNYDEGETKCRVLAPQTTGGSWLFNPEETVLTLTVDAYKWLNISFTIEKLDTDSLIGYYEFVNSDTMLVRDYHFYAHQR